MVSSGGDGTFSGETGREGTVSCAVAHIGRPHTLSWASEILRIIPPGQGGGMQAPQPQALMLGPQGLRRGDGVQARKCRPGLGPWAQRWVLL